MLDINKAMMNNLEQFYITVQLLFVMFILFIHKFVFNMDEALNGYGAYIIYGYFIHVFIQFIILLKNLSGKRKFEPSILKGLVDGIFIVVLMFFYKNYATAFIPVLYIYLMFQALRFPNRNCFVIPSCITLIYLVIKKSISNNKIFITENITIVIYIFFLFIMLNLLSRYVYKLSRQTSFMFDELNEKNLELQRMASKDYLTNMYNHRTFYSTLSEVAKKLSDESSFSMAMFDIDDFKVVNDTYGHLVGDFVLKGVSSIILEGITGKDVAARYGGEEFAILFPNKDLKEAFEICESIRKKIEDHLFKTDNYEIKITISCGIAETNSGSITACDHCKFVDKVDKMLYRAKSSGKNCIKFTY